MTTVLPKYGYRYTDDHDNIAHIVKVEMQGNHLMVLTQLNFVTAVYNKGYEGYFADRWKRVVFGVPAPSKFFCESGPVEVWFKVNVFWHDKVTQKTI